MTHFDLITRDRTIERMLIRGGFNRDTLIAVNTVLKSRFAVQRPATAPPSAVASSSTVAV